MKRKRKKAKNDAGSRSYRMGVFVTDSLAATSKKTGLSANALLDMAATAAFSAVAGKRSAVGDFAALLDAAAANHKAEEKAQRLTMGTRKELRAARAKLKAATGEPPTPAAPSTAPRQSA